VIARAVKSSSESSTFIPRVRATVCGPFNLERR
jgi:hypothetical protein